MSQLGFCKEHGLDYRTFCRWRKMFEENGGYRLEQLVKKRAKRPNPYHTRYRGKAQQAFWAMHVEALRWSGLSVAVYAKAHRLSRYTLARWRDKLMAEPEEINWRDIVHPSARPEVNRGKLSPMTKPMTKQLCPGTDPFKDRSSNRRTFTLAQKRAIVLETNLPNITVSDVARRYDIATSVLFRWRRDFDGAQEQVAKLVSVQIIGKPPGHKAGDTFLQKRLPRRDDMVAVELADGTRVFAPTNSVERAIRPVTLERKNHLFAGSDQGGKRWAIICSFIETAKMNGVEPYAYLQDILQRMLNGHPEPPRVYNLVCGAVIQSARPGSTPQSAFTGALLIM